MAILYDGSKIIMEKIDDARLKKALAGFVENSPEDNEQELIMMKKDVEFIYLLNYYDNTYADYWATTPKYNGVLADREK